MWVRMCILGRLISASFEQRDQTHGVHVHVSDSSTPEMFAQKKSDLEEMILSSRIIP